MVRDVPVKESIDPVPERDETDRAGCVMSFRRQGCDGDMPLVAERLGREERDQLERYTVFEVALQKPLGKYGRGY
jgi:hypothetical protein